MLALLLLKSNLFLCWASSELPRLIPTLNPLHAAFGNSHDKPHDKQWSAVALGCGSDSPRHLQSRDVVCSSDMPSRAQRSEAR